MCLLLKAKRLARHAVLAWLAVAAANAAHSQVYSWVDENGQRHFGDRIPEKYREKTSEVQFEDVNEMLSVQPEPERRPHQILHQAPPIFPNPEDTTSRNSASALGSCEE
jgi:hypothetical protein